MISLYIKEIKSFLSSIIGYVFVGVFLIISGLFLWVFPNVDNIPDAGLADLHGLFNLSQFLFLFLVPAITMRSFAEERRTGTMDLLLTKPLTDWQIIWKVLLPEAKPSLLLGAALVLTTVVGYSCMSGFVGGGGLGDIAIRYGYYRYDVTIMMITVVILIIIVQLIQEAGSRLSKKSDRRIR